MTSSLGSVQDSRNSIANAVGSLHRYLFGWYPCRGCITDSGTITQTKKIRVTRVIYPIELSITVRKHMQNTKTKQKPKQKTKLLRNKIMVNRLSWWTSCLRVIYVFIRRKCQRLLIMDAICFNSSFWLFQGIPWCYIVRDWCCAMVLGVTRIQRPKLCDMTWKCTEKTNLTNPRMHLFHNPECPVKSRNVHISVLNGTF